MFQANLRGVKRLAVSLVLVSGFAGLGLTATDLLGRAAAQDRSATSAKADEARSLMRQARAAYDAKNYGKAKELAQQAQALRAPSAFYDDTPEELLSDIAQKSGTTRASKPSTTDPKILMNMAKQAFDAGELDKAQDLATQAQANQGAVRWGLFDDTPASLLKDIAKAKGRRDRDISEKMIEEARALMDKRANSASERAGNLFVAEEKAKMASKMHGPYSMWDFSDRPEEIITEVKKLRDKEKLLNIQPDGPAYAQFRPVRTGTMDLIDTRPNPKVKSDVANTTPTRPTQRPSTETGDNALARKKAAVILMQEANALKQGGHYAEARAKLIEASRKNAWFGKDEESPEAELAMLSVHAQRRINTLTNEARTHMARKDNTAALVKLDEAHQLAASMGLDAEGILDLRSTIKPVGKPVKSDDVVSGVPPIAPIPSEEPMPSVVVPPVVKAPSTPADIMPPAVKPPEVSPIIKSPKTPEAPVVKAPVSPDMLPVIRTGGKDDGPVAPPAPTQKSKPVVSNNEPPIKIDPPIIKPIESPDTPKLPEIVTKPEPKPEAPKVVAPKVDKGEQLLTQARLAIRSGDTETAKKLVIEVLAGQYSNKAEAEGLLNSIEAEERNQKANLTRRAFEKGMELFNAGDNVQALAIFKQIDSAYLPATKKTQLSQMMEVATARLKNAETEVARGAQDPKKPTRPMVEELPAPTPKVGADNLLKQQEALSQVEFQKLRAEALKVESTATARFGRGETDAALQDMQNFVAKVKSTGLDSSKQALLTRPIEARMDRLRILKHQTDFLTKEAADRRNFRAEMAQEEMTKQNRQNDVAKLMRSANKLMDEAKYKEAYAQIQAAAQLDPDDPSVNGALQMAERMYRMSEFKRIKSTQEKTNWELGNELYDIGNVTGKEPLKFTDDPELRARMASRTGLRGVGIQRSRSEKEKDIERKLSSQPISLNFKGQSLEDVVTHLQRVTDINFDLDLRGLKEGNIDSKQAITLSLNNVSLKSGLNILCQHAGLKHVIENETIRITTAKNASGRSTMKSLSVGDLIVPIQSYGPQPGQFQREQMFALQNRNATGGPAAPARMPNLPGGMGVGSDSSMGTPGAGRLTNSNGSVSATINTPNGTLEKELIRLITTTVRPDSWQQLGGDGTIEYFPIGMALVINQSPEVIEEVERLLESLRKLQDLEVTIELKVVSLSETFFERIGVDFSMGIRTNGTTTDPRGLASPPQAVNRTNYNGNVIGLAQPGVPTPELDIPIRSTSFARAIPPFGGFGNSFADGGLSLGLAFLSELQVQMFLEAAQGDTRTNVMHAPKITAINGASAQITVGDFQFFLTGVTVQAVGGQLLFTPNNTPFLTGTANPLPPNQTVQNGVINFQPTPTQTPGLLLFVQPVVSADRRFVRLNIRQEFVSLVSGTQQIPFTTIITPTFDNGGTGQPIPFTQFLQQPRFSNIATDTVVVVPDGGTVVMGGLKWMTEGRNEFGPPVLSKIPYLNRLFKNVAYGREGRTMLLMVTPRIVINREEQERQTGFREDDNIGLQVGP